MDTIIVAEAMTATAEMLEANVKTTAGHVVRNSMVVLISELDS
jgi:hypothetical protein